MNSEKNYSWNASDYAKNSQNQFQWAKELIPKLRLQGNEYLLDIGCGDGKITAEISKCLPNGKAIGIDSSSQMINLAITSFTNEQYPNLNFQLMDARNLPFEEEFDLTFSNAALHWIPDQKAVLQGVQRSLKQQGRLLFQMAGKGNAQAVLKIFDELLVLPKWQRYFDGFAFPYAFLGSQEYRQLLVQVGLKPVRVDLFPREMKFPSAEGMAGWVRTTWLPFTERIPVEMRDDFVKEIVSRYLADYPADDEGVVHLDMMRLEVEAQKA
jgi:trans-aconitate 2-methyltransferase